MEENKGGPWWARADNYPGLAPGLAVAHSSILIPTQQKPPDLMVEPSRHHLHHTFLTVPNPHGPMASTLTALAVPLPGQLNMAVILLG